MSEVKTMSSIQFPNTQQPYQVNDERIPADPGAYKYMATDGEGNYVAEDRLAWKNDYVDFSFGITPGASEEDPQLPEGATLVRDNPNYVTVTYPADNYFTGNLSWLIGRVITFVGAEASKTYTITAADIDSEGNLLCEYVGGCQLSINSSTGVVVLQVGVYITGGVFFPTQPAAIVERTYHPIPAEYIPRIVFTYDGTNYTCNVPFEEFEGAVMSGLPIVYVDLANSMVTTWITVTSSSGTWNINAHTSNSSVATMVYTSSGLSAGGAPPS